MVDIRISPERLRQVASHLENQKNQADDTLRAMINEVNNLQGEWTGMAQVDYANLFNENVPQMQNRLREILEGLIRDMRRIADTFEDTDQNVI